MISYILKLSSTGYILIRRVNGDSTNYVRPSKAACNKLLFNSLVAGDAAILHFASNDNKLLRRYVSMTRASNV